MAPSIKKPAGSQAEATLLPSLKNCLVNLPSSLVSVLVNSNTVAQNVVVELQYRQAIPNGSSRQASAFLGWTGMQAKRKMGSVVGREGIRRGGAEQDVPTVEVDSAFASLLGLTEGQKVGILLHLDPPQAHTINIEPLTPADWDMIELHAQFLELNFLSQVRALPNPAVAPATDGSKQPPHPLTLHLSPTSSVNVTVTSLSPAPPNLSPFVKISPDAEVIVAPKTREKGGRNSGRESKSVTSTSRRSVGGKSGASTVRRSSNRDDHASKGVVFLRAVDRTLGSSWFDETGAMADKGLRVWVDEEVLLSKPLKGVTWVSVSVVKPSGLQAPAPMESQSEPEAKPAFTIVARLGIWEGAPDPRHVTLSSTLSQALGVNGLVGGLIRVEAAPLQAHRAKATGKEKDKNIPKILKVLPFASNVSHATTGLKFGGESKQEREEAARKLKEMYGSEKGNGILEGPLTHGMVLPAVNDRGWQGGLLTFDPAPAQPSDPNKATTTWFLGSERTLPLEVQSEIAPPSAALKSWSPGHALPTESPVMVGTEQLMEQLLFHACNHSSVLLTGGLGSGKTSLACLVSRHLRVDSLFHTVYFPCRTLMTDETRVSTIKETLSRLFASAAWGARLSGRAIVILDDLDRLCPAETELQVGGENGRSRHVSESLCALARQYCSKESGVVLLTTAQSKEALNNVIVGGHVVRDIMALKAPSKEGRRRVLELLAGGDKETRPDTDGQILPDGRSNPSSRPDTSSGLGFTVANVDFLDLAGQTDGYQPGDLVLLTSRARSEALIRSVSDAMLDDTASAVQLIKADYTHALQGFTPASLRNVTLQSSTTRWDSIGGLRDTRQTLLETLQYPTTYAPIFSKCPLRLRSGLLLYGYPGCGKTLLASAVAGECGLNFISVKGPEILNKYIGASEKSVRDLFERAEAARPCVLFFDEFDSIAPKRGHDSTGVTDRVVNQLLTQMDGAEGLSGVYVLAATSRPDLIDPALLRPGRLDKSLMCDMPSLEDRVDILRALSSKLRFAPELLTAHSDSRNLRDIASRTEGYSGADLQAVVYNAQLEAIHDVLGDQDHGGQSNGKDPSSKYKTNGVRDGSSKTTNFTYFRYDGDHNTPASHTSSALAERAEIAAKLESMQAARRRQKQLQYPDMDATSVRRDQDGQHESSEPVIQWKHILTSLSTTRSSISPQERNRLRAIYKSFVSDRNGELPDGQAGNEIGGRTSLM